MNSKWKAKPISPVSECVETPPSKLTAPPVFYELTIQHVGLVAGAQANEVAATADADDVRAWVDAFAE